LTAENEELKSQVEEVEGWYRLLQADHAALQHREGRADLRATDLQAEVHRLAVENEELRALVARHEEAGHPAGRSGDGFTMTRITEALKAIRRHKWATAAVVAFGALLARDPAVQGLAASVTTRARQAIDRHRDEARDEADSGFLRYAALVNTRDELERLRDEYNAREATLKGDALLEAQDRLRAAKACYR